jgi:serine/tyrosine/threonine adenylyltransferase
MQAAKLSRLPHHIGHSSRILNGMNTEPAHALHFDNCFVRELPGDSVDDPTPRQVSGALYSRVAPTPVAAPRLLACSAEVLELLGLDPAMVHTQGFADIFGGNALLPGMQPYAANYGGHQFGHWAGQLGDGRAITLGEIINAQGQRWELQLKGAGPTPYSRTADGRAVLRSSIREFLCSEAMHHLGIPTTRALSLVTTGEGVVRDMFYDGHPQIEAGAIVCRVAPSFLRFGNFELPAARGESALLEQLIDFTLRRDFPEAHADPQGRAAWFSQVCERTAVMVAHWMRVGFVHGVMNTDNMSILGLTIDYGPYGWIDNFDLNWTPNTTDAQGRRYRFGHQPQIAFWNLQQLVNALATVFESHEPLHAGLQRYVDVFTAATHTHTANKLGLTQCQESDLELMQSLYGLLQEAEVDMTRFFRELANVDVNVPRLAPLASAFYDAQKRTAMHGQFQAWLEQYAQRVRSDPCSADARRTRMDAANPRYVLRNYLSQQVIDRAEQGDFAGIHELLDVMRHPYDEQPGREAFAQLRPDWARQRAGCSMLSCSS